MKLDTLHVSEHFFSIQGEGMTVGKPAVFLRLQGCPLACTFCDTTEVWKKGRAIRHVDLLNELDCAYNRFLTSPLSRLVITGGSPTVQQKSLVPFLDLMRKYWFTPIVELETEGYIMPSDALGEKVDIFNVSPKLSNSGVETSRRLDYEVLAWLNNQEYSCFKFVVGHKEDVFEAVKIVKEVPLSTSKIMLMPLASTRAGLANISPFVVQWCKEFNFNFSTRLQLSVFDQATGV